MELAMARSETVGPVEVAPEVTEEEPSADVVIGRIVRPFGRHGEVVVEPLTDDPQRFSALAAAQVGASGEPGVKRTIESVRIHKGRPVVRFSEVEDISAAESLRAHEVRIPSAERAPLPEGRWYQDELVGSVAEDTEGERIGEVVGIEDTAGPSLLVLRTPDGCEHLVPFVEPLCVSVDPDRSRVVLDLPEGLLEVNDDAR